MAKTFVDDQRMDAAFKGKRCVRVTKVVEPNARESCILHMAVKGTGEAARPDRGSVREAEDELLSQTRDLIQEPT